MFEVDLRLNVAAELQPDGKRSNNYEWYGFRGMIVSRSPEGKPTYLRGVAINIDRRVRIQKQLFDKKKRMLREQQQQTEYCLGVIQEMNGFLATLAGHADEIISGGGTQSREEDPAYFPLGAHGRTAAGLFAQGAGQEQGLFLEPV